MSAQATLSKYRDKRHFHLTSATCEEEASKADSGLFVVQRHAARSLHYDFRLELDGTLKSWAILKGPSLDPSVKRNAVEVEDHPVAYAAFEGEIPQGQYGAGTVIVWDRGHWSPVGNAREGLREGSPRIRPGGRKTARALVPGAHEKATGREARTSRCWSSDRRACCDLQRR